MDHPDGRRFVEETAKDPSRPIDAGWHSPYQRDRARVLHSAAFRRLASKTQVHAAESPAGPDDAGFLRTRLTHSLEVAQIAREMGGRLGCDPDVVDTAGLAHDLGHPPFGHVGEGVLDVAAARCGGFEGNAQTLRVLTRLEAKVYDTGGRSAGLNLTRACLDAVSKYPWYRRDGGGKFGAYADDAAVFDWLRDAAPAGRRCLEAEVMDWADDVAYSVHDVEDGIFGGYLPMAALRVDADERAALCADAAAAYLAQSPEALALESALLDLLADPVVVPLAGYDGSHRAQAALKRATSVLTGRFVAAAVAATRDAHGGGPLRRYTAGLVVPDQTRAQCVLLKGMVLRYVMRRPGAEAPRVRQQEVLYDLVGVLAATAPRSLDPVFAPLWARAPDDAARLRTVVDQVASLTDPAALAWHHRLVG